MISTDTTYIECTIGEGVLLRYNYLKINLITDVWGVEGLNGGKGDDVSKCMIERTMLLDTCCPKYVKRGKCILFKAKEQWKRRKRKDERALVNL